MPFKKQKFDEVERTLLGSLSTRAKGDLLSAQIFGFLKGKGLSYGFDNFNFRPALDRTAIYDIFIMAYIKEHPRAKILNIGCGMCTRFQRLDNGTVEWMNIDKQVVIDLRREFFGGDSTRHRHVAHDLNRGLPDIPYNLLVAEGCLVYLPLEKAKNLIKGHCILDVYTMERKVQLGPGQHFCWDPSTWPLNVLQYWHYDNSNSRGSTVLEVMEPK